ncbi:MAG: RagB/SusD family nutrient uptake outer membrane protein [Bacteroidota bacterium]|nr:RagB/SusD family nutrient uptake outer membrane protein [Bacteroidota bacterium]
MKNKIIYIGLLLSISALSSCKKQLDLLPSDSIPPAKALSTVADLQKGLFGVYAANSASNKIYIGSILADETKLSNANRGQGQFTFKWQYSPSEGEHNADFASYYGMIDDINKILAVIDGVPANSTSDANLKKRTKAELLALRGIAHYEVLIRFMSTGYDANSLGIPIMLKSDLLGQPARAKVGDVVTQINTDLAAGRAEPQIPNGPGSTDGVVSLSQAAIAAYQARVSLLTKDWAGAVTHANEAIQLSGKTLATGQDFLDYWFDKNEIETIWKYRNEAAPQLYWTDTNGDVFFEPSDKLKNEYDRVKDIRFQAYFLINPASNDTAIVNKYPGSANGPQINDLKLLRVAEPYLDLVEAYAQQNDLVHAAQYINQLRAARIAGYVPVTFATKSDAINAALDERFKELCFEGFRFFDLKRNSLPINRLSSDVQSVNWQNLLANDYHFALPIPQHEMFANKNMAQNPGY